MEQNKRDFRNRSKKLIYIHVSYCRSDFQRRPELLESFADLPCESCNNIVSFNFYLIIVSNA